MNDNPRSLLSSITLIATCTAALLVHVSRSRFPPSPLTNTPPTALQHRKRSRRSPTHRKRPRDSRTKTPMASLRLLPLLRLSPPLLWPSGRSLWTEIGVHVRDSVFDGVLTRFRVWEKYALSFWAYIVQALIHSY